jgi:anti-sigma B factor antagonist
VFPMRDFDPLELLVRPDPDAWLQQSTDTAAVLSPAGELDLDTAGALERSLADLVESTDRPVVLVDLAAVDFIDASCITVIVRARAAARSRRKALYVQGLRGVPAQVFDALGLRATLVFPAGDDGGRPGW